MKKVYRLEEHVISDKRLGRHVEHDTESRSFAFETPQGAAKLKTVHHKRYGAVLNQGNLGSCTGNATTHAINCKPLHVEGTKCLVEKNAVAIYELATKLDDIPGTYPPDDTGSSGLSAAKAAQQLNLIKSYSHAFNMNAALAALQLAPVITGVNWYEGFDNPDPGGNVSISGQVRGGHEFCVLGFEYRESLNDSIVVAQNSWGSSWGHHGQFQFTVSTWKQLLAEQGDVTILSN